MPHDYGYDRRRAYVERLLAQGLNTKGKPYTNRNRAVKRGEGKSESSMRRYGLLHRKHEPSPLGPLIGELIPHGAPADTLQEWLDMGLHVEVFKRLGGEWMIRVGDRELSVEEYLLLFEDEH